MTLSYPDPDLKVIMVFDAAGQRGPVSRRELLQQLGDGEVDWGGHFWFDGLPDWLSISGHAEIVAEITDASQSSPNPSTLPKDTGERALGRSDDPWSPSARQQAALEQGGSDAMADGDWAAFGELLTQTWEWDEEWNFSTQVDEVFMGALITGTLNQNYFLMTLDSDGTHHDLGFEHNDGTSRITYRISYLSDTLPVAKVLGHRVSVLFGYGERATAPHVDSAAPRAERFGLEKMASPGTLILLRDAESDFLFAKMEITLNISEYVGENYSVDTHRLGNLVKAVTVALRSYLRHRAR